MHEQRPQRCEPSSMALPEPPPFAATAFLHKAAPVTKNPMLGKSYAQLAYKWQTGYPSTYPTDPVGDPVAVSTELYKKYSRYFRGC